MKLKIFLAWSGLAVAVVSTIVACGGGDDSLAISQGTVIRNVTVVITRDGSLSAPMSVIVNGNSISKITSSHVNINGAAQEVDGTGKYLCRRASVFSIARAFRGSCKTLRLCRD